MGQEPVSRLDIVKSLSLLGLLVHQRPIRLNLERKKVTRGQKYIKKKTENAGKNPVRCRVSGTNCQ